MIERTEQAGFFVGIEVPFLGKLLQEIRALMGGGSDPVGDPMEAKSIVVGGFQNPLQLGRPGPTSIHPSMIEPVIPSRTVEHHRHSGVDRMQKRPRLPGDDRKRLLASIRIRIPAGPDPGQSEKPIVGGSNREGSTPSLSPRPLVEGPNGNDAAFVMK